MNRLATDPKYRVAWIKGCLFHLEQLSKEIRGAWSAPSDVVDSKQFSFTARTEHVALSMMLDLRF